MTESNLILCVVASGIETAKDVVSIIGTFGGIAGLTTWRRQIRGTAKHEIAKRVILLTYQVRDAIQAVRSPMLFLKEEDVQAGKRVQAEQRAYAERMQRLDEKWSELRTATLEAQVFWKKDAEACVTVIRDLIGELRGRLWEHFWIRGAYAGPATTVDRNPARIKAVEEVIYLIAEDDPFSTKLNAAVEQVETVFRAHI